MSTGTKAPHVSRERKNFFPAKELALGLTSSEETFMKRLFLVGAAACALTFGLTAAQACPGAASASASTTQISTADATDCSSAKKKKKGKAKARSSGASKAGTGGGAGGEAGSGGAERGAQGR